MTKEWDLERYFYSSPNDDKFHNDIEIFKQKFDNFISKHKLKIAYYSIDEFFSFLEEYDVLDEEAIRLSVYLNLLSSLDIQNQDTQKELLKIDKIFSDYSEKLLFVNEEFKEIGYENLIALSGADVFKSYKNFLVAEANSIKYNLSNKEEIVGIKLSNAYRTNLYEELTSSFEFDFRGETLTGDEVRNYRNNSDRTKRFDAFKSLSGVYLNKQNQITLSNLYSTVCKDSVANMELRGYKTVVSKRNISEEVSDEVVDILLKKVSDNYWLYHKFLDKKTKYLGLDKIEVHDVFASFPTKKETNFEFEQGWELYKKTINKIDPLLSIFSDEMLEGERISVYPKKGKTSGAYAQYGKSIPEFILLNWTNSYYDIATLAHELGHAFHGNLSKCQKELVYGTPLILAETASIFNETLMFEKIIESVDDEMEIKRLIFERLDDIFLTIFRQIAIVSFEKRCHESFKNNEPLTFDDYNAFWLEEMKKLYGQRVVFNDDFVKYGWSSISHIYQTPFYCYTYALGNIISLNVYQQYKESDNKEEFITKYHEFLSAGGSDTPENLLKNIFNIEFDDKFYKFAFDNIENLIDKL